MYCRCDLSNWNKLFLRVCIARVGVAVLVCRIMRYRYSFCLVSIVCFNCAYDFLYYDMDIETRWNCALVSCTASLSIGLFLGMCAVLVLSVIMYSFYFDSVLLNHDCCDYYWDFYVHCYSFWPIYLGFLKLGSFCSSITHLPGCLCPWNLSLNILLNMLPLDAFMLYLDSLLENPTGSSRFCNWLPSLCLVP